MKNNINNYYKNIIKSEYYNNNNFDIPSILLNAKINKTFNKLLNLCIKYEIKIFDIDSSNIWYIQSIKNIITIINNKKNKLTLELSINIGKLVDEKINIYNNCILDNIDNLVNDYKKKIKDLDILYYLFNNIYTDEELKKICNMDNVNNDNNMDNNYLVNNILKPIDNIDNNNLIINKNESPKNNIININKKNITNNTIVIKSSKNNKFIAEYSN